MSIIIYSKPDCVQCNATYRAFDKQGIDYQVIDLTQDQQGSTAPGSIQSGSASPDTATGKKAPAYRRCAVKP
ncbi:glutaredoxin [Serratia nematodiphila DZ0503SBS1]|nr:glutaredoxin [Serratia nematodiphila DZ0503SBS1]